MIKLHGKTIQPEKLQLSILHDLHAYQKKVENRAKVYSKLADIHIEKCYICGNTGKTKPIARIYGFEYVTCERCTHVYATFRLSQKSLNAFYKENEEYAKTYTNKEQVKYRAEHIAKPKVEYVMRYADSKGRGSRKTWLDVGCGIGDVLWAVEKHKGWKGTGVEISTVSADQGKKLFGVDIRKQLLTDFFLENPSQKFDAISFFGYFGLISEPMEELALAAKHLKKGGCIIVGEENAHSLSTIVQQSYPNFTSRHLIPPNVIHQFTEKSLQKGLSNIGFKPLSIWNFGLDFYECMKFMVLLEKDFQNTPLYTFFMKNINAFQSVVDAMDMGDYMVVIAREKH